MAYNRRYAAKRIQGAYRKYAARRGFALAMRKRRQIYRSAITKNNQPTYVETFKLDRATMRVPIGGVGVGSTFKVRISEIPQWLQYANLYKQYRINWVKVMLIPQFSGQSAEPNTAVQNITAPTTWVGSSRIAYAIQDSPNVGVPLTEAEVLQDNGAKVKSFKNMWSCSFKPVPDVSTVTTVGNIYTRQKFKQWFNFDTALVGNNPEHGAVQVYITIPGLAVPGNLEVIDYFAYFKVSFTLRDPQ